MESCLLLPCETKKRKFDMRSKTSYSKYHYQLKQSQQYWVKNEDDMNCRNTNFKWRYDRRSVNCNVSNRPFPIQTMWCSPGNLPFVFSLIMYTYARGCMWIRWHLTETVLWGTNVTWCVMGKQNIQAEKIYCKLTRKKFQDFNRIRTHGLCVSAAVL